ncbi:MAG: NAD-glutamate dehydrogenase [Proteobacteria bacterium]|nr:NAD-glutamate dehydrogenase [Pseudomonadota bacterium]
MDDDRPVAKELKLNDAAAHARRRLRKQEFALFEPFMRLFYRWAAPEDVEALDPENLFGAALAIWRIGTKRKPGRPAIRVYNPNKAAEGWESPHTVIELVNDDMPFLVDSVTADLERRNLHVHLVIHPILSVTRNARGRETAIAIANDDQAPSAQRESWIHAEIDLQTDPAQLEEIAAYLARILSDVRATVEDWRSILEQVKHATATLEVAPADLDPVDVDEAKAFLAWMADDHFTFLGYRRFDYIVQGKKEIFRGVPESGLGILRDPEVFVVMPQHQGFSPEVQHFLKQRTPMIVTKASRRSTVHRSVYLDYVGIKRFDQSGRVIGEDRFVGLFTSTAYSESVTRIPHVRRKVARVTERSGLGVGGHGGKALLHILETFPRNELFQISVDDLYDCAVGIMHLEDRPRTRLFLRSDPYKRFASCLVYVPREKHTSPLRERIGELLAEAFRGRVSAFYTYIGDEPLARLHYIIGRDPEATLEPDADALERRIAQAARSWNERLLDILCDRLGQRDGHLCWERYRDAFPIDYQAAFSVDIAIDDIDSVEALAEPDSIEVRLYRRGLESANTLRVKLYRRGQPIPLTDCMPLLENMGVRVIEEHPFRVEPDGIAVWIHDFLLADPNGNPLDLEAFRADFEDAFERVWTGEVENDGFNALVIHAGLDWRAVTILRAYAKYMRQIAVPFSQELMERTLVNQAMIAKYLVELFAARFDPAGVGQQGRTTTRLLVAVEEALVAVDSLDEDRILRQYSNLIETTIRSNHFQPDAFGQPKPYLAIKFDCQGIEGLPLPRPMFEIFVYSPRFEGIHLRGGRVARGGLRWSDRREDFRTEILGLMKAQMVKNAVIVPVGAKGGFVPKRLPDDHSRDAVTAEGVACYKMFVSALLDITDNLVGGEVVPPPNIVRHDGDDPYLVVAADKGTATFSDTANGVAQAYGFWLDDAFASGGSVGYDHKKMGITAKGAWESVKRHFREIGVNTQTDPFTKMVLYEDLLDSTLPDDLYLGADLQRYFPKPLRKRYDKFIEAHRLRREIIATFIANSVVNRVGPSFVNDMVEDTACEVVDVIRAYIVVREAFDMRGLWGAIEALDNKVGTDTQAQMIVAAQALIQQMTSWFLRNKTIGNIAATIDSFAAGFAMLSDNLETIVTSIDRSTIGAATAALASKGVPGPLAARIAGYNVMAAAGHIVEDARASGRSVVDVAGMYFLLGERLGLDWLRAEAQDLVAKSAWEQRAIDAIVDDFYSQQCALTRLVLAGGDSLDPKHMLDVWEDANAVSAQRSKDLINEFKTAGGVDIARLAIANRHVRTMIVGAGSMA